MDIYKAREELSKLADGKHSCSINHVLLDQPGASLSDGFSGAIGDIRTPTLKTPQDVVDALQILFHAAVRV